MGELFNKLIELIVAWIKHLLPFTICGDDEVGVVRRFGKWHRNLTPGLCWKIPIVESPIVATAALDSTMLQEQTLTTSDGRAVTLRGVITYRVVDPRKYILDCATAISVMNDVGCCVIAEVIPTLTADVVLRDGTLASVLLRPIKLRAKRWGVAVDSVGLVDRVESSVVRLITSSARRQDETPPGLES